MLRNRITYALVCLFLTSFLHAQTYETYLSVEAMPDSYLLLPNPPEKGTEAFKLDSCYYFYAKSFRGTPRGEQAIEDSRVGDDRILALFSEAFGYPLSIEATPEIATLLLRAKETFGDYATRSAKLTHARMRPFVYFNEPTSTPDDEPFLRGNGSYPSGHTAIYTGISLILSEINPERQNKILKRGQEGGFSRMIVGAHWYSDVEAGKIIAGSAYARLNADPEYLEQLRLAKEEFAHLKRVQNCNLAQSLKYTTIVGKDEMLALLLKYLLVESGSEYKSDDAYPMTAGQEEMAKLLRDDIVALGAKAKISPWGYVYVDIPSNIREKVPVLGISCHLDYTPEAPGKGIKPTAITYSGGDIALGNGLVISPSTPEGADLHKMVGNTLIHSDGTTLLGGDDKNGCAIVMSLLKSILDPKCKHGRIQLVFCPNEDIGMAAEKIDTKLFNPDILFDVDGLGGNDISVANFTARGMKVRFVGKDAFAGEAKRLQLGDAVAAAATYIAYVPVQFRPENTEGLEGYIHHWEWVQDSTDVTVNSRIRYFDKEEGELFDRIIQQSLKKVEADFPNVQVNVLEDKTQYDNVAYTMYPASQAIVERAAERAGQSVNFVSERSGNTAAMFTAKGLKGGMCIFSGQHNVHSVREYSCLEEMMDAYHLLLFVVDEIAYL